MVARKRRSGLGNAPAATTIRPGAGSTQTSPRRSLQARAGVPGRARARGGPSPRSPSRSASSATTRSGSSTCRNSRAPSRRGAWRRCSVSSGQITSSSSVDGDVDLPVVGGHQHGVSRERGRARPARRTRRGDELRARRPVLVAGGVDRGPSRGRSARAWRAARRRRPRCVSNGRPSRPANAAEPYGVSAIVLRAGARSRHVEPLEERSGQARSCARVDAQRRARRARARTAAGGSRRRPAARRCATRRARAPRPAGRCRAWSGARWWCDGNCDAIGSISSRRSSGWSAWRCTNAHPKASSSTTASARARARARRSARGAQRSRARRARRERAWPARTVAAPGRGRGLARTRSARSVAPLGVRDRQVEPVAVDAGTARLGRVRVAGERARHVEQVVRVVVVEVLDRAAAAPATGSGSAAR